MGTLFIGELARQTGVKVPTIRYYEGIGLLPVPQRQGNNRRTYDETAIARLVLIKHARSLGFEVADIRTLLTLRESPNKSCRDADRIARAHLADVERRISELERLRADLKGMIDTCHQERVSNCHVLETLSDRSCGVCADAA